MADLYLLALERAKPGSFYFVENGEASFGELVQAIADALGLGEAQSWPADEAIAEWGFEKAMFALASNSRVRSDLARAELGWQPRHGSVVDWVRREPGNGRGGVRGRYLLYRARRPRSADRRRASGTSVKAGSP